MTKEEVGRKYGFRSGLEEGIAKFLQGRGIKFSYEEHVIPYLKPARVHKYTPDFVLENGIIVESKGRYLTADRQKHIQVKEQHPDLDIRFVFSNPNTRISKNSPTTYAKWCDSHGFLYAAKSIPQDWLNEPPNAASIAALASLRKVH